MKLVLIKISIVVSLFATYEASCLRESEEISGFVFEDSTKFSNYDEIVELGASNYTFYSFTTCVNEDEDMIGTLYTLSDSNGTNTNLTAIGNMTGTCQTITLTGGPIERLKASYSTSSESVSSIRYVRDGV